MKDDKIHERDGDICDESISFVHTPAKEHALLTGTTVNYTRVKYKQLRLAARWYVTRISWVGDLDWII